MNFIFICDMNKLKKKKKKTQTLYSNQYISKRIAKQINSKKKKLFKKNVCDDF